MLNDAVLEVVSDAALDEHAVQDCVTLASLLTELTVTRGLYGDLIEQARRREPMQLAAEMLRAQLPPLTFSTGRLVHAILDYQDDRLQDDATVLLAEWLSPAPPHSDTELFTPPADDLLNPGHMTCPPANRT